MFIDFLQFQKSVKKFNIFLLRFASVLTGIGVTNKRYKSKIIYERQIKIKYRFCDFFRINLLLDT